MIAASRDPPMEFLDSEAVDEQDSWREVAAGSSEMPRFLPTVLGLTDRVLRANTARLGEYRREQVGGYWLFERDRREL